MRQTSIEAYNQILNEGLIGELQTEVYKTLFNNGPLTGTQIHVLVNQNKPDPSGSVTGRLSELRRMGVVQELGVVKCPITHRSVILWDVTEQLPITKREKIKTKDQIIKELQDRISVLEKLVPNGTNDVTIA